MTALRDAVQAELATLAGRVVGWSTVRWTAPAQGPVRQTRQEAGRRLVLTLGLLGSAAGSGAPAGVEPPVLAASALSDQWLVLGHDLLAAPHCTEVALQAALAALLETRTALDGTPPPSGLAALAAGRP